MIPPYEQFRDFVNNFPFDGLVNARRGIVIYNNGEFNLVGKGKDPSEIIYRQLCLPIQCCLDDPEKAYAIPSTSWVLSRETKGPVGELGSSYARWLILLPRQDVEPNPRTHLLHEIVEVFFREDGYRKEVAHMYALGHEKRYAEDKAKSS